MTLIGLLLFTSGCASTSKGRIYQSMAAGALIGAMHGYSKPENKDAYALMWSGVGAAVAGAIALHHFDPGQDVERLKAETSRLQEELDRINSPRIEAKSSAFFGNRVPEKYRDLINPGEWRVSQIDQWVEDDENRLIHQDLVMELVPPSLNPVIKPVRKKESSK
jgi:hypothetical protein